MNKKIHTFVILAYKESEYLEECIKSVLNQTVETSAVIVTSTPNKYISNLAKKYSLSIIEHKKSLGIADDFNNAVSCIDSELVTIAHQDDVYDSLYAEYVLKEYDKYKKSIILFTDYYEIRNRKKVYKNKNHSIKNILLTPIKIKMFSSFKFNKRIILSFGNSICCPSVTFCKKNINTDKIFVSDFKCNMDWLAWERLSKLKGNFIYINKPLMGHRVHEKSTTTEIINSGVRTKEDYSMFLKFWPKMIAKLINKFYKNSEKSNEI